ncbi:MAG: hypothetical protein GX256_05840 [Fretibacterium sp.]|nr:hypothetical protein [Fretibacterium sp.]
MNAKTAQSIAETTSEVIGYGVLVTDAKGIIIGCNDRERLGKIHTPSLAAMSSQEPSLTSREEAAKLTGVKPGYTIPLVLAQQVVGSIAIAGPPQRTKRYGLLVKKQAEILLREQAFLELQLRQQLAMRDLAESVLLYRPDEDSSASLLLHGKELGFDLNRCRIAVVAAPRSTDLEEERDRNFNETVLHRVTNFFANPSHFIAPLRNQQLILFLALSCGDNNEMEATAQALCQALCDHMEQHGVTLEIGIGLEAGNLPELSLSARSARRALLAGRALGGAIHSARELSLEILLSSLPALARRRHISATLDFVKKQDEELLRTFLAWCENPFEPAVVSKKLAIHRNTLLYRLKKIRELSGLDPWNFRNCFSLWSALTLQRLFAASEEEKEKER